VARQRRCPPRNDQSRGHRALAQIKNRGRGRPYLPRQGTRRLRQRRSDAGDAHLGYRVVESKPAYERQLRGIAIGLVRLQVRNKPGQRGGPDGAQFARVALNATSSTYSIITSPRPITSPVAGSRYTASGWVRSERPGKSVCLRFREWSGSASIGAAQSCRTATGTWERFTAVPYSSAGGDSIELYAYQSTSAVTGDSFDVDGLTFTAVP